MWSLHYMLWGYGDNVLYYINPNLHMKEKIVGPSPKPRKLKVAHSSSRSQQVQVHNIHKKSLQSPKTPKKFTESKTLQKSRTSTNLTDAHS